MVKKYLPNIVVIILLLSCGVAIAEDDWSRDDTIREATWMVIHAADWNQTRQIARNPDDYHECNPIMGAHPSVQEVDLVMGAGMILHPLVSYALPAKYRIWWQYITIGTSALCVGNNFNLGIGIQW